MQTTNNIINRGIASVIKKPFLYLINLGHNPYLIFILLIVFLFSLYFIFLYQGNFKKLFQDFKKMSPKQKLNWFIFLIGGILIAGVLYYNSLNLFYKSSEDASNWHSNTIDNKMINFGDKMTLFLEKIGIVK